MIARALRSADVTAASVNFVETHGTGTALGDPIEFDALAAAYGKGDTPCALGAVKTNFGHLEAAAGITGLIKAVLALRHSRIPPNLNFTEWNPAIDAAGTRFFIPTKSVPWPATDGPRRAAVSSFGMGGTNAHVVLEQGPGTAGIAVGRQRWSRHWWCPARRRPGSPPPPGCSPTGCRAPGDGSAPAVAAALNYRSRFGAVATVSARDHREAVAGLRARWPPVSPVPAWWPPTKPHPAPAPCSCTPGRAPNGPAWGASCWPTMAGLRRRDRRTGTRIPRQGRLFAAPRPGGGEPLSGIARIQPVLVGIQLALTALWRSYGVEPDAVIGHSMGEVTAAVVAGALTSAEGLDVIATRSRLMSRLSGQGRWRCWNSTPAPPSGSSPNIPRCRSRSTPRRRSR